MSVTSTIMQAAPNQYEDLLNNYVAIVEKTNQQLSLWYNPYGLMVGLLAIIIAVVAIVVSFLLWKNSDEQKKRAKEFFDRQEENLKNRTKTYDRMLADRSEMAEKYEKSFDNLIEEYQKKLANVNETNKEEIARLEQAIDDLSKSKASLGAYAIPEVFVDNPLDTYGFANPIHTMSCFGCGKKFQYKNSMNNSESLSATFTSVFVRNKKVICPHCGQENFV